MTLAERLRQETRPLHEQTEQLLHADAMRDATLTVDEYFHLLQTHWLFHQALETALDQHPAFFPESYRSRRRKTPWLSADLADQGIALPTPQPQLFADWSPVQLLGAAYVSEGSMLGGKVVMHYLQKNAALQPLLHQALFYRGYGASALEMWKEFNAFLAEKADQPDEVVEAAGQAFRVYHAAFQASPPVAVN